MRAVHKRLECWSCGQRHGPDWQPRDRRTLATLIGPRCRFITGPRDRQERLGESQGRSAFADRCVGRALTHQGRAYTVYSASLAVSRGSALARPLEPLALASGASCESSDQLRAGCTGVSTEAMVTVHVTDSARRALSREASGPALARSSPLPDTRRENGRCGRAAASGVPSVSSGRA